MAVFSINQVRHLYVAKKVVEATELLPNLSADNTVDSVGSIMPKVDKDNTLYFQYKSPAGLIRSDLIATDKIMYAKATPSDALAHKLTLKKVVLDANVSNEPVAGQEYILRVIFKQYVGLGEEDTNIKYGFAKATPGMTASDLYKKIALSLVANVARDTNKLIKVYLDDTEVTPKTKEAELTGTYTSIELEQVEQAWELGTMPQEFIPFEVQTATIIYEGEEYLWGTITDETPVNTVDNGKNIADLEYFCMGARGDMYRKMGYPNYIKTTYLVDETKKYDTLDIHYAFTDSNEGVQKSEKDITIVCENDGNHTLMNALIEAVNSVAGLEIATL